MFGELRGRLRLTKAITPTDSDNDSPATERHICRYYEKDDNPGSLCSGGLRLSAIMNNGSTAGAISLPLHDNDSLFRVFNWK